MLPRDKSILFADDNPDDLFLIRHACREAGIEHPIQTVKDGEQVIAYLEGRGVYADRAKYPEAGLVVLDLKMPKTDGLETLRWIRNSPRYRRMPVLLFTASMHPGDIQDAYDHWVNAFVTKPSTAQELLEFAACLKTFWTRYAEYPPAGSDIG